MQSPTPNQDDARYTAALNELIDLGMDMARRLHQAPTTPETTIAFDRIARAIRRTIALARHIAENPPAKTRRTTAREKIIRDVEDAIHVRHRNAADPSIAQILREELNERLEDPALEFDLYNRPIEDIINDIARDLGLASQSKAFVWKRRTPNDVTILKARAAQPANAPPPPSPANPPPPPQAGPLPQPRPAGAATAAAPPGSTPA